jgi:transposase
MAVKFKEKETAIELRKQGYSYSEILKRVPVAKSTLSLWLRSVGLAERQKQRLSEKKESGTIKGSTNKKRTKNFVI